MTLARRRPAPLRPAAPASPGELLEKLTPTERKVLHWVEQGKRNAEIAVILGCSKRTIDCHVGAILKKLGVETRGAAGSALRQLHADGRPPRTPPRRRPSAP